MTKRIGQSITPPPLLVDRPEKKCSLLKVVSAVAVGALAVFSGLLFTQQEPIPEGCYPARPFLPYSGSSRIQKEPSGDLPYEPRTQHPGIISFGDGAQGYLPIGTQLFREKHLAHVERVRDLYSQLKDNPRIQAAESDAKNQDTKGFLVVAEHPTNPSVTKALFALNPSKEKSYKTARKHTASLIREISTLSERDICKAVLQINELLLKPVANGSKTYRQKPAIIFRDNEEDQDRSLRGLQQLLLKRGATQKELNIFTKSIAPHFETLKSLSNQERKILGYLGYVPPNHEEIPALMKQFAKTLKEGLQQMKSCSNFDPVGFAAYAHQEVGRIHPFTDGNGRTSRLLMNEILKLAGYQAAVFLEDEEYTEAVIEDGSKPGAFANYLRNTVIPRTNRDFNPHAPCLPDLSCGSQTA